MKKLIFAVFFVFIIISIVSAQARLGDFTMRGAATQVMKVEGLFGAHPSLPFDSVVKVTNPKNNWEVEVTIIGRIDPSLNRVIDLSSAAMKVLGIRPGEQVVLTVTAPPPTFSTPNPTLTPPEQYEQYYEQPSLVEYPSYNEGDDSYSSDAAPYYAEYAEKIVDLDQALLAIEEERRIHMEREFQPVYKIECSEFCSHCRTPQNSSEEAEEEVPTDILEAFHYFIKKKGVKGTSSIVGGGGGGGDSAEFLAWLMSMTQEARQTREARDSRDVRELREARESRELRDAREQREMREAREARELREAREIQEAREARELREARYNW